MFPSRFLGVQLRLWCKARSTGLRWQSSATTPDQQSKQHSIRNSGSGRAVAKGSATETHEVFNQSTVMQDFNAFECDAALKRSVQALYRREHLDEINRLLSDFGARSGSREMLQHAEAAEKNPPTLQQFDPHGRRIDVIEYHPSYHALMRHSLEGGAGGFGYQMAGKVPQSHVARAAMVYMSNQLEPGHCCPVVMTAAAIPVLSSLPGFEDWSRKLTVSGYDGRDVPMEAKLAITAGMSMTEKQGGSDVRANTTTATPLSSHQRGHGCMYSLVGHKWFTSAPMSDAFLTLAKTEGCPTPSCFLVPRWLPDGTRNTGFRIMRLKNKLADRANASGEVEYHDAVGSMLGEEGRGVRQIIEMVSSTRLDCALGSAGGMRRAVQQAVWHAGQRRAFGRALAEQPLMRVLLADLCVESEAATAAAMVVAQLWGEARGVEGQHSAVLRVAVAVAKYAITRRAPAVAFEAMEAFGGNGFVEDFPMAKLFRHSPLNSIWEGSGNVICLNLLQAAPAIPLFIEYLRGQAAGRSPRLDAHLADLEGRTARLLAAPQAEVAAEQRGARAMAEELGVALLGSSLLKVESPAAEAFIESRCGRGPPHRLGSHVHPTWLEDELLEQQERAFHLYGAA